MRRIGLAVILALSLFLAPFAVKAQPPTTIPRIGLLADAAPWAFLKIGLRDLGYAEGKSIALEERSSQEGNERFSGVKSLRCWISEAATHSMASAATQNGG